MQTRQRQVHPSYLCRENNSSCLRSFYLLWVFSEKGGKDIPSVRGKITTHLASLQFGPSTCKVKDEGEETWGKPVSSQETNVVTFLSSRFVEDESK